MHHPGARVPQPTFHAPRAQQTEHPDESHQQRRATLHAERSRGKDRPGDCDEIPGLRTIEDVEQPSGRQHRDADNGKTRGCPSLAPAVGQDSPAALDSDHSHSA